MNNMKRFVETTDDGSTTLRIAAWDEPYHSMHGAIQESRHVFINNGLRHCERNPLRLLEIGFGTGLNALLSLMEADSRKLPICYTGIEAYPLTDIEVGQLNYLQQLNAPAYGELYAQMHTCPREVKNSLTSFFTLVKHQCDILEYSAESRFDLIYFDAFGAGVQPELWTEAVFSQMYRALDTNGILVTYAARGSVRRAMQAVGFRVERLPGPPGKREMLRAVKPGPMDNGTS
jgi:tRNA U34 5-methylaminomethyl-2-thiouridine-forming methyltransferase MnmC